MQTIRRVSDLRAAVGVFRATGESVALVPTMGALHAGHLALVAEAKRVARRVVVSIFVNPRQFGVGEDLDRYPRREATDAALLRQAGIDLLWAPASDDMYPDGFATTVSIAGITDVLDGAARPGHFDGVATVVAKLLNQVRPDIAVFGEKDFQQLAVVRRMVADLDLGVEVIGVPTQRDDDGLALSSRNAYLVPEDRAAAVALPRTLGVAAAALDSGEAVDGVLATARTNLEAAGFAVDYIALVDAESFGAPRAGHPRRLLAAARIGGTRLIDNLAVSDAVNEQG